MVTIIKSNPIISVHDWIRPNPKTRKTTTLLFSSLQTSSTLPTKIKIRPIFLSTSTTFDKSLIFVIFTFFAFFSTIFLTSFLSLIIFIICLFICLFFSNLFLSNLLLLVPILFFDLFF